MIYGKETQFYQTIVINDIFRINIFSGSCENDPDNVVGVELMWERPR